jgi:predicted nucleic-acid-binding Zn-ribbon protein
VEYGFTKRKCPKCGGNLYLDSDYYIEGSFISWYEEETCLQCGFTNGMEIPMPAVVTATTTDKDKPAIKELVVV